MKNFIQLKLAENSFSVMMMNAIYEIITNENGIIKSGTYVSVLSLLLLSVLYECCLITSITTETRLGHKRWLLACQSLYQKLPPVTFPLR